MVLHGERKDGHRPSSRTCIAPETIVVVLNCTESETYSSKSQGQRLFSQFKRANASWAWDRKTHEAINKIKFAGYLRPYTLLIHGSPEHVSTIRNAWIKNVLRAPPGFTLNYFGKFKILEICYNYSAA